MTRGVFIIAFGRAGYGYAAYNLAFSIKKFSPDIPITLWCEAKTIHWLSPNEQRVFDEVIFIPQSLLAPFDPCRIKINAYDYLPYDINLFMDADSLALKDITECFSDFEASGLNYATHIHKTHTIDKGRDFPEMWWAWMDEIWEHYKLPQDAVFPATNSSWQFVKKSDEAKKLFDKVKENYNNPFPIEKLKNKWGGTQPDELYLNVAMAQLGFKEYDKKFMFFGTRNDSRANWQSELINEYNLLSTFGGGARQDTEGSTTKRMYLEWYDKLMFQYCREYNAANPKTNLTELISHKFKIFGYIIPDKHLNNPLKLPKGRQVTPGMPVLPQSNGRTEPKLIEGLIPIKNTIKVDSRKLIQSYPGPNGETVRPTNYFNCSIAEFEGKIYFAYRMERAPWTTKMKIGLCLLDGNLQPIADSHSVLNIDTDRKIYQKDFQAEDPRLFVFNNQLFISYMGIGKDGYAMGQARINTETMQAEDSFYYAKKNQIEKNWTFFEHDGKLYSVYNTSPHTIFEVNDKEWTEKYKTDFVHNWKYGILRGGTPPQRYGDYFISFFHSSLDINRGAKQPPGRQYFAGAYLFEAQTPFKVVAVSKEPFLAGEKIDESIPRMWNKLYVVFPNGKIRKENSWIVSFGYNDLECRFAEITDAMLEENLVWIKKKDLETV